MRFRLTTDYAIRMVLFMAQHEGEVVTAEYAAAELGITYSYFNKVAWKIKKAGYIESVQGPHGGYRIAVNPTEITLHDIVGAMEGDISINRCLDADAYCSQSTTLACPVHKIFVSVQKKIIDELQSVTIHDLCLSQSRTE